ncbi:Endothelin-converting enzyme 2, partial [Stegodyphus mimosarum]
MVWRAIHQSLPLLSKDWRNLDRRTIDNPSAPDSEHRWQHCTSFLTDNYLGMAITSYFVRHYFKNESVKTAHSMTEYIHEAFTKMLGRARWMDEEAFTEALDKASTMA